MKKTLLFLGVAIAMASCSKKIDEIQTNLPQSKLILAPLVFDLPEDVNPENLGINEADTTITYSVVYYTDSVNTDTLTYSYSYSGVNLISVKCDDKTINSFGLSDDDIVNNFTSECISNWEDSYGKVMGKSRFANWLEKFFIGEKQYGPCLFGQKDSWRNHWLVGVYGNRTDPC
jgi:hypothetical protein